MTEDPNIRTAIAALAMHALIPKMENSRPFAFGPAGAASAAVLFADALLAELAKPRTP